MQVERYQKYHVASNDVWISWGICIHSFFCSLDFLVFCIESEHEISFVYYL